jgi:hypothetical protein
MDEWTPQDDSMGDGQYGSSFESGYAWDVAMREGSCGSHTESGESEIPLSEVHQVWLDQAHLPQGHTSISSQCEVIDPGKHLYSVILHFSKLFSIALEIKGWSRSPLNGYLLEDEEIQHSMAPGKRVEKGYLGMFWNLQTEVNQRSDHLNIKLPHLQENRS